ncbi:hypothetical protein [Carboxydothermus pertinax]|uniref:Type 4 fimbrial biogenesis protein PilX N-terminal domain-containing protein n=1 Tax=Carboxydothermus pertinax TaxID=870242 RepID=A0A1L8CVN3_9THEO|nr:hypothetical protein [Carboxydothermus pertinax]GAV22957.1 hypothetical protein cpu_14670 [Carboxydothermus pertinax]
MFKNEKGYILFTVLVIGIIFAVLATGLFSLSLNEKKISSINLGKEEAYYCAEAGLKLAVYSLEKGPDRFLQAKNLTLDELSGLPVGNGKIEKVTSEIIDSVPGSTYTLLLKSTGLAGNGAKKTLQAKLSINFGVNLNNFALYLNTAQANLNFNKKADVTGNLVVPGDITLESDDIKGAVYGRNVTVQRGQGNNVTITKIIYFGNPPIIDNRLNIPAEKINSSYPVLNFNLDDSYLRALPNVEIISDDEFTLSSSYNGKIVYIIPSDPNAEVKLKCSWWDLFIYDGNYVIISPNPIKLDTVFYKAWWNDSHLTIISTNGDIKLELEQNIWYWIIVFWNDLIRLFGSEINLLRIDANLIAANGNLRYHDNSGKLEVKGAVIAKDVTKGVSDQNVKARITYDPNNNLTNILQPFIKNGTDIKILEWKELYPVY